MAEAALSPGARANLLAAMGIEVYRLRDAPARDTTSPGAAAHGARFTVVCARGGRGDARLARLYAQLPAALGTQAAAMDWCEADASGAIDAPPAASAYLVLGSAVARALGAQLSTAQQQAATIAVTAEPAQLPGGAAGKRALWQALKPLAHRLRSA